MAAPGFILIHRRIEEHVVFSDDTGLAIWLRVLLRANWKPGYFQTERIERGEFAFSWRRLSESWRRSHNTIRKWFAVFEREGMIRTRVVRRKFTVLTVIRYNDYQIPPNDVEATDTQPDTLSAGVSISDTQRDTPADTQADTDRKKNNEGETKGMKKRASDENERLPVELDTPEFRSAWTDWQQHRREIRKTITPTTRQRQLKQLVRLGPSAAVESIEQSIEKGWTGLFAPKPRPGSGVTTREQQNLLATEQWLKGGTNGG